MIRKLVNNRACEWEGCLGQALWAHRISTSSVTGFTPFFLQYGRRPRAPLTRMLGRTNGSAPQAIGERIDNLVQAFTEAARGTEQSRKYNRERLRKRAKAGQLSPGDHVILLAQERAPLDAKWDHVYIITRVRGPVITVVNTRTNKSRTVNRDKLRLVDPDMVWEGVNPRLTRAQRHRPIYVPVSSPPQPDQSAERQQSRKRQRVDSSGEAEPPEGSNTATSVRRSARIAQRLMADSNEPSQADLALRRKRHTEADREEPAARIGRRLGPTLCGKRSQCADSEGAALQQTETPTQFKRVRRHSGGAYDQPQ